MKGIFYFPPNWSHARPDMEIPSLIPYLHDFDITACDLNIQYRIYQRSRENLDKCLERIKASASKEIPEKYDMLYHFLADNKLRVEYILHDREYFIKPKEYMLASLYERELQLFHKRAYEKDHDINLYDEIIDVIKMADNEEENYYLDFYTSYFAEHALNEIKVILIFPAGRQQIVSTFTLCRYMKRHHPDITIIVGGRPFCKMSQEKKQGLGILFENALDYIITYPDVQAVYELLTCIVRQKSAATVPGCIYMQNGTIIENAADKEDTVIENVRLPDFSTYHLLSYNVPEIILPYSVARVGCRIEKIITDLCLYQEKYHAEYVHFTDETISPETIGQICHAILDNNLHIKWFLSMQIDGQFTRELRSFMERAGAVLLTERRETSPFDHTYIFEEEHLLFLTPENRRCSEHVCNKEAALASNADKDGFLLKRNSGKRQYRYCLLTQEFDVLTQP